MKFLIIILFTFQYSSLWAQTKEKVCPRYYALIKAGKALLNNKDTLDYKGALNHFLSAQIAARECGVSTIEATNEIQVVFKLVEDARIKAVSAEREAIKHKSITQKALKDTKKLNEFIHFTNKYLFKAKDSSDQYQLNLQDHIIWLYQNHYSQGFTEELHYWNCYNLTDLNLKSGNFKTALDWSNFLCETYPDSVDVFQQRGLIYYYLEDWINAQKDINKALSKKFSNKISYIVAMWNKALIESNLSNYDTSIFWTKRAIKEWKTEQTDSSFYAYDSFIDPSIREATSISELYSDTKGYIKIYDIYCRINDVYSGKALSAHHFGIDHFNEIPINELLILINYLEIHKRAVSKDYISSLLIGYFWELGNYPKPARKAYQEFRERNKQQINPRYAAYAKEFRSPIYDEINVRNR